ncbi:MAG: hypothetical protein HQM10_12605 [Candidatus Riflebacteria bacterium]|nr:hypothetical protein [Candidatus Riflebacteria bacterium]
MSRRGMAEYLALSAVIVFMIFTFAANFLTRQRQWQIHRLYDNRIAAFAAKSAVEFLSDQIIEALKEPENQEKLLREDLELPYDLIKGFDIDISKLTTIFDNSPGFVITAKADLEAAKDIDPDNLNPTNGGYDPLERVCRLKFKGKIFLGNREIVFEESRELRIVNLCPNLLSRFTLFVTRPSSGRSYNKFFNDKNGNPVDTTFQIMPIVLRNSDPTSPEFLNHDLWKHSGLIYFGGPSEVTLNLTAGSSLFGELFHFFRIFGINPHKVTPDLCYIHANNPNLGNFFNTFITSSKLDSAIFPYGLRFLLRHFVDGVYAVNNNGKNLNSDGLLENEIPSSAREPSSCLHLFGDTNNPSPTMILGRVARRFLDISAIVVDVNNDNTHEGIVSYLYNKGKQFSDLPGLPAFIDSTETLGEFNHNIPLDVLQPYTYEKIFSTWEQYKACTSTFRQECYLNSYDYMFFRNTGLLNQERSLFSPDPYSTSTGKEARIQKNLLLELPDVSPASGKFPRINRTKKLFFGNQDRSPFNIVDNPPSPYVLKGKAVYVVKDIAEFMARFASKGKFHNNWKIILDAPVLIKGKMNQTFRIPSSEIEKGGIIIMENGDLTLSGITKSSSGKDEVLTIAALNGNINLDFSSDPARNKIEAFLVALNGRVWNLSRTIPVKIKGGISTKIFPPDFSPSGGEICYDCSADPVSLKRQEYYRFYISDVPES